MTEDILPVVNVTQLERDTVLICYDRKFEYISNCGRVLKRMIVPEPEK